MMQLLVLKFKKYKDKRVKYQKIKNLSLNFFYSNEIKTNDYIINLIIAP